MTKKLINELKKKLEKEKIALIKELESFATEDTKPKGDWDTRYPKYDGGNLEEEADEAQEYDKLLSLEYSLELKLKDVNSALEKIKKGKYGLCEKCAKKIDEKRLQACPEAKLCMKCKKY
jgi:DnaK suppressor protein